MPKVFIGAGSNADPKRALRRAASELEQQFGAVRCSNVYRSAAVGGPAAPYLNLVLALSTERDVDDVRELGRKLGGCRGPGCSRRRSWSGHSPSLRPSSCTPSRVSAVGPRGERRTMTRSTTSAR